MRARTFAAILVLAVISPGTAAASGHGPVFGAATPTLGKGGWSFDQAWMGSLVHDGDSDQALRTMLGFGITKDVQVSVSLPVELSRSGAMPMGRMTATMSSRKEAELLAGWRVRSQPVGDTARLETTVYLGGTAPLERERGGVPMDPAVSATIATGYASRTHYFWLGGSYQRPLAGGDERAGDVKTYSIVYGYRPPALRFDYPTPDLRFFVETVGEVTGPGRASGRARPESGGRTLMAGPTALLLYKAYGVSGGVLFPVYQRVGAAQAKERLRFAINISYFFWIR